MGLFDRSQATPSPSARPRQVCGLHGFLAAPRPLALIAVDECEPGAHAAVSCARHMTARARGGRSSQPAALALALYSLRLMLVVGGLGIYVLLAVVFVLIGGT